MRSIFFAKAFGTSSEKHPVDFPGQFNLLMKQNWNRILQLPKQKNWQPHFRQKHLEKKNRATDAERFKGIPVIKNYLDLPEEDKICPVCNTPLVKSGEEFVRRELVFVPARLKVVEIYSLNYSCPECSKQDVPVIKREKTEIHICFMAWLNILVR